MHASTDMASCPVSIDDEIAWLDTAFSEKLAGLPPSLRAASAALEARIGLRNDAGGKWVGRLAPLTMAYPTFLGAGIAGVNRETARTACLAHLCILIYAFLDDRRADGQLAANPIEISFADRLLEDGLRLLSTLAGYDENANREIQWWLDMYAPAHEMRYMQTTDSAPCCLTQRRILKVATSRAALGAIAPMALAVSAGMSVSILRRMRNAFASLVTALQWSDDLSDWREDLVRGEDNLLLCTAQAWDESLAASSVCRPDSAAVAEILVRRGVFEFSADQARRWYAAAAARHRELGCPLLGSLIEERASTLGAVRNRIEGSAAFEAVAGRFRELSETSEDDDGSGFSA